jgi:hypothetical protein
MNCEDAPLFIGLPDDDPRAVKMRAHIRACAYCRALVDHQNNVRSTLALKRYEQPPPGFSERCAADIRRQLEQQVDEPTLWWQAWGDYLGSAFQPLRLAAAAVLLLGIGFYFLRPVTEVAAPIPASWSRIQVDSTSAAAPLGLTTDNTPLLLAASNSGAVQMNYGPGAAVPVKFEY